MMSAPIISAYCVASVLWSRLFLKEKLSWKHYLMIGFVVAGIVILGISRQGVHDAISRSEALLASFERVTGCVAREQKLRHALAAITAEAQPLLQAGDPATRQGAQRILAAVDSLKE